MSLDNNYWITPLGDIKTDPLEHVQFAAAHLIGRPLGESVPMHMIKPRFRPELIAEARAHGVSRQLPKLLSETGFDARRYVAERDNWVRVVQTPSILGIELYQFDEPTLDMIRSAPMWKQDKGWSKDDVAAVNEISTGDFFDVPLSRLLRRDAQPEAIRRTAHGVGQYHRNPGGFVRRF